MTDADAFNAFEAAGWNRQSAGYDDFFGQTPRAPSSRSSTPPRWAPGTACSTSPPGPATWPRRPPRAARRWSGWTSPTPCIEQRTVAFLHRESSAERLWDGLMGGTVRMSALVRAQDEETQRRVREAFDGNARRHVHDGGLALPVSIRLASGRKA